MAKSALQAYTDDAGNGQGYLYILDNDGSTLLGSKPNDSGGLDELRLDAARNIPVSSNTRAFGTIAIDTAPVSTVVLASVTIGGVNQLQNPVTLTGLTDVQTADAIRDEINSFASATDYTATTNGITITVYSPASLGSTANAHTISLGLSSGSLTTTIIDPSGGSSAGADTSGHVYKIDANYGGGTASALSVGANAVNITSVVVQKSASSGVQKETVTISSGLIDVERNANETFLVVSGESGVADTLTDISTAGRADGDLLWLIEGSGGEDITVTDTGNINIVESIDFVIDAAEKAILLRYDVDSNDFTELFRTSVFSITVAGMRTASIPQAVSGTNVTNLATGGGTINLDTGVDEGYQIYLGTGTLTSSHTIQGDAGDTPLDGDVFWIDYRATFTPDGNNVTIFGLSLTDIQILNGNVLIKATWDDANSTYRARLILDLSTNGSIENDMIPTNEIETDKLELQTGLAAGSYTNLNATIDAQGIITAISSGSALSAGLGAFTENMALVLTAGTLRITSADGTIFSSSNVGKVVVSSTSGVRTKVLIDVDTDTHFFIDDAGVSTIIGEEFGVTTGVAWGDARPFYLYACNLNNTSTGLKFAISPNPTAIAVPAATNLGYHANPAATPSDLNFSFLSASDPAGLATKPCALIGRIRMTMSASDDWTIVTDGSGTEIGIDNDPFFGYWYDMPLAQMGAASGTFLKDNGGTAPIFTNNSYKYQIGRDGQIYCVIYLNGDGGTDGATAVTTQVVLPYLYSNTVFDAPLSVGFTVAQTNPVTISAIAIKNTTYMQLQDHSFSTPTFILNDFYANGIREIILNLRYQAFII